MKKPPYVFDREAEWSALESFVTGGGPGLDLGVVSGRRRQGKTLLLSALSQAAGGFIFSASQATEADSLRQLGEGYARHIGLDSPFTFGSWDHALDLIFSMPGSHGRASLVIFDEFPYLVTATPALPSYLQRFIDRRRVSAMADGAGGIRQRLILCGSALSFMGNLLSGAAPLRGRAGLELVVPTLDFRKAAEFWGLADPKLAVMVYAIVGGTPAYRREFVRDDSPADVDDFDDWVCRTVLNPGSPLFREGRYLLAEEPALHDQGLYHSVLAAIAEGNATRGGIAAFIGRKSGDIGHPLTILQDCGLIRRDDDALAKNRSTFRIAEPLIRFYQAVMRPIWGQLETASAAVRNQLWRSSLPRFTGNVVGPAFEHICRVWAAQFADPAIFTPGGTPPAYVEVGSAIVNDAAARRSHEVDVLVLAPMDGGRRRVLSVGEVKWGAKMGLPHLERLMRIRDVLAARTDLDAREAVLACYSGAGFSDELRREADAGRVLLISLEDLYGLHDRSAR